MCTEKDSLKFLPMERWGELEEVFKAEWPRGVAGYCALRTQRELAVRGLDYGFKVYCPYGDVSSGMVALNKKDTFNDVIVHSLNFDTTRLENALLSTKVIDWSKAILGNMPEHTYNCVSRVVQKLGLDLIEDGQIPHELMLFDQHQPAFENISLPDDMIFQPLLEKHIDVVNAVWTNRYASSKWLFRLFIRNNESYCLFQNNELVAWVFVNEVGALCHLYTVNGHRKKGYGKLLMQLLCNKKIEEEKPVFGYCMRGNVSAEKLYNSLCFKKLFSVFWTARPK